MEIKSSDRPCVLIGMPGPFNNWIGDAVIVSVQRRNARLVRRIGPQHEIGSEDPAPLIYVTAAPGPSLLEAIAGERVDVVAIVEDVGACFDWVVRRHRRSSIEAIRLLSAATIANRDIARNARARILPLPSGRSAGAVLRAVLTELALPFADADIAAVLSRLGSQEGQSVGEAAAAYATKALSGVEALPPPGEAGIAIARRVLDPVVGWLRAEQSQPVVWSREILMWGDAPDVGVPETIPLVGPARNLVFGPYLHLPPGAYRADVLLAFAGRVEGMALLLEMHGAQSMIDAVRFVVSGPGAYRATLTFSHDRPLEPVEMRLRSERGAIEGDMGLLEARLWPQPAQQMRSPDCVGADRMRMAGDRAG